MNNTTEVKVVGGSDFQCDFQPLHVIFIDSSQQLLSDLFQLAVPLVTMLLLQLVSCLGRVMCIFFVNSFLIFILRAGLAVLVLLFKFRADLQ